MALRYKRNTLEHFSRLYHRYINIGNVTTRLRNRFEYIDMAIERTSDTTREKLKSLQAHRLGRKDRMRSYEVPLIAEKVDTLHTKLTDFLLTGSPVFAMVGVRGNAQSQNVANQYTALMEQDQERFGWQSELSDCLRDSIVYNCMAMELTWASGATSSLVTQSAGQARTARSEEYQGIKLKHIDPYNFVFDTTVPLHELQSRGTHAGYLERHSYLSLYELLQTLDPAYKQPDAIAMALKGSNATSNYFEPTLHPLEQDKRNADEMNWAEHFGLAAANGTVDADAQATVGRYEVFTLYYRCIPAHVGIGSNDTLQDAMKSAVFKLVYIGDALIYAQPLAQAFAGLPIFAAHLRNGKRGFGVNSFAEDLEDVQDSATAMLNGSLSSMRKAVGDRMLYDARFIKSEDINSANPVSKIPVRIHGFGTKLSDTYAVVPYRDDISQWMFQHIQFAGTMADNVSGINRATQGNFTKGNRTMQEFNTIMDNSEGRLYKHAIQLESRFFAPLKRAIKLVYMQNVSSQDIISRTLEQNVRIDPMEMLKYEVVYRMADGINSVGKQMNTDVLTAALNTIAQSPVLATRFDIAGIFAELMATQRVDLTRYALQQQEQPAQEQPSA